MVPFEIFLCEKCGLEKKRTVQFFPEFLQNSVKEEVMKQIRTQQYNPYTLDLCKYLLQEVLVLDCKYSVGAL